MGFNWEDATGSDYRAKMNYAAGRAEASHGNIEDALNDLMDATDDETVKRRIESIGRDADRMMDVIDEAAENAPQ